MSNSNRVTIKDIPREITEQLRTNGISRMGNQYLLVGYILDQAGIIPDLIRAYEQSSNDKVDLLDAIEKAVRVGRIFINSEQEEKTQDVKEPEPSIHEQKAPTFGA
jgi:hypothetical protein